MNLMELIYWLKQEERISSRWDRNLDMSTIGRAVCLERGTHGSKRGKAREGLPISIWVTKLTLDASYLRS